jgi:hypothetical protein
MRLTALFGFGWIGLVVDGHFTGLPRPCQRRLTPPRPALLAAGFLALRRALCFHRWLRGFLALRSCFLLCFHFTHLLPFQIVQPFLSLFNPFCRVPHSFLLQANQAFQFGSRLYQLFVYHIVTRFSFYTGPTPIKSRRPASNHSSAAGPSSMNTCMSTAEARASRLLSFLFLKKPLRSGLAKWNILA